MVNNARPGVYIELGGKERKMTFDLNAMAKYEELTGKNILKGMDADTLGAGDVLALIFSCMVNNDPGITISELGSWITAENMVEVTAKLNEAFSAAIPEKKDGQKPPLPVTPAPDNG